MAPKGIQDLVNRAGGDLPHEVARILSENGWNHQIGPHYIDVASGKTREIDVVARKTIEVRDEFYGGKGSLLVRLFIECKYLETDYLLHFTPRDRDKATAIIMDNSILRQQKYLDISQSHYLVDQEVAKTWSPSGRDDFYDAWTQSVHSMIYFSENQKEAPYVLDIPVVLFHSFEKLYKREQTEEGYSAITNNFQLEVDYSYPLKDKNVSKTFLVDFVSLKDLPDFLNITLQPDISLLRSTLVDILSERSYQQRRAKQERGNYGAAWM